MIPLLHVRCCNAVLFQLSVGVFECGGGERGGVGGGSRERDGGGELGRGGGGAGIRWFRE